MSDLEPGPSGPTAAPTKRKRVLFVAEQVSLAQVVRLRKLAAALQGDELDIYFATQRFDPLIFAGTDFTHLTLPGMSPATMYRRQRWGLRLYGTRHLKRYVEDELHLLQSVQPDLVIGDLRLSLTISAKSLGIPLATLINAYWSPQSLHGRIPMPEHPLFNLLGRKRIAPHFEKALPWVFDYFARPVNRLRRLYGLAPIGSLREVLTYGDYTLFPDIPDLTPLTSLPAQQRYLGPVLWAPHQPLPELAQLDKRAAGQPLIYVTMGSSGNLRPLRRILRAVSGLPVRVLLATAARTHIRALPDNVIAVPFVAGDAASAAADLVICNGGSGTGYQALAAGTPVLGLPSNLDQYLAMEAIERAGAGRLVRSGEAQVAEIQRAIRALLRSDLPRMAAARIAANMAQYDSEARFRHFVREAIDQRRRQPQMVRSELK